MMIKIRALTHDIMVLENLPLKMMPNRSIQHLKNQVEDILTTLLEQKVFENLTLMPRVAKSSLEEVLETNLI